ncbi:MAG: aminopeptidase P N-terminal domain-containing protein [Bacteroidales bacterium]|nr:aminopeptidase P N-terminal domain-containing protein [Bacteroidales bacterium]
MFNKKVYISRRQALVEKMVSEGQKGIVIFIGNVDAPAQYKDNAYKFRQDSTWLYYFGLQHPAYAAILDLDENSATIYADDVEISDIVWMGPQIPVSEKAASVGVSRTASYDAFDAAVRRAHAAGRDIHYINPSRYYNTLRLMEMLGITREEVVSGASLSLTKAIIEQRLVKEDCEVKELEKAAALGYIMHSVGRDNIVPGIVEQEIVGLMEGAVLSKGWGVSFATILTQHGETLHNHLHDKVIVPGKLMVIDAGAEIESGYASDHTRTYPTSGKFTQKQRDIYEIVRECNEYAFSITRPGITYREVHILTAKHMLESLAGLGIVKGNVDDMFENSVAGLFMPHGLGHNMGLDVHDMEDLGENLVGYDVNQSRSRQLGLGSLRMARELKAGHVITDEPGIYFIPALIAEYKNRDYARDYINFNLLEKEYLDFGGIRLEDDVLVTPSGARHIGADRLPIAPADVEAAMAAAKYRR